MEKIMVENVSVGGVNIQNDTGSIKKSWVKPGDKKPMSEDEIRDVFLSEGGEIIFTKHLLIHNKELRVDLGIEEADISIPVTEVDKMFKLGESAFRNKMESLNEVSRALVAKRANDLGIDSMKQIEIIKEYTGADLLLANKLK